MARSFMNDPYEKKSEAPIDEGKVMENIEAVNAALKSSVKKREYNRLYIDHSDVTVLLNIVPTLDPMEEAITYLGGDKHITASSVLPFLVNFNTFLETNEDDPLYVTKFKSTLKREMIERCVKHLNFQLLTKSSYFDKRYSKLSFVDKMGFLELEDDVLNKGSILEEIKIELVSIQEKINGNAAHNEDSSVIDKPVRKKTKFLLMACDGGESGDSVGGTESGDGVCDAVNEMNRYAKENTLKPDADILQWWFENRKLYPCMSVLARKYLCIQATSTTAERAMSLLGNIVTKKRICLTDENVKILTYLSDCY